MQEGADTADGWNKKTRGMDGPMEVNSTRFPSGISALADWLHGKGKDLVFFPGISAPAVQSTLHATEGLFVGLLGGNSTGIDCGKDAC